MKELPSVFLRQLGLNEEGSLFTRSGVREAGLSVEEGAGVGLGATPGQKRCLPLRTVTAPGEGAHTCGCSTNTSPRGLHDTPPKGGAYPASWLRK